MIESEMLKYGALGFAAVVVALIMRPLVSGLVRELRDGRTERSEMREQFMGFIQNHAAGQTEALYRVKDGLAEVAEKLAGLNGRGRE
jgi:hypothetical protein